MIKRITSENIVTEGLGNAKPFWTGVSTIPTTVNGYGEELYTGEFSVFDVVNSPNFDGYCQMKLMQSAPLVGSSNFHYIALRETQYLLPVFRAEDTNVYCPLSVVFDWAGDPDSYATLDLFSSDAASSIYAKTIFSGTKADIFVNGIEQTVPSVSGFFTSDRTTRKLWYRVFTQNITGYVEKGTSIKGRLQIALTDVESNITRVLHDAQYVVNPFRTYQFEARLSHK